MNLKTEILSNDKICFNTFERALAVLNTPFLCCRNVLPRVFLALARHVGVMVTLLWCQIIESVIIADILLHFDWCHNLTPIIAQC